MNLGYDKTPLILNLGCGKDIQDNWFNVDLRKVPGINLLYDLTKLPLPWKDNSVDGINAKDIVEHFIDVISFIDECGRILKVGGSLRIRTTYWKTENSFTDPSHYHFFTLQSFDYWDPATQIGKEYGWYTKAKFKILSKDVDGQELEFVLQKQNYLDSSED